MGELVRELETLGYLERAADPGDGRALIIRLTDRGRRANEIGIDEIRLTEQRWAGEVGADSVRSLREVLERLSEGGEG